MDQASSNHRRIKACNGMLRSNAFATSNYRKNCRIYECKYYKSAKIKLEADHIIDLDLVSSCFCKVFLPYSLKDCLKVMCLITPILNGQDNLCWILKSKNTRKRKKPMARCVRKYMYGRMSQMQDAIAALHECVASTHRLSRPIKKFVILLAYGLVEKYNKK